MDLPSRKLLHTTSDRHAEGEEEQTKGMGKKERGMKGRRGLTEEEREHKRTWLKMRQMCFVGGILLATNELMKTEEASGF